MAGEIPAPRPGGRVRVALVCALALSLWPAGACDTGSGGDAAPSPTRPSAALTEPRTDGGSTPPRTLTVSPSTGATGTAAVEPEPPPVSPPVSGPPPASPRRVTTAVYFLHGAYVSPAPRTVTAPATAEEAVRALLAGPDRIETGRGRTTAIPSGTSLRSLAVRDGVATVDLSGRYDDGGGSLSMRARLAQVVYTVTRYPSIDKVRFRLDGEPVTSFGGEGIALDRPVGRGHFEDVTPAVLVESPLPGGTVRAPVRVWGTANTFEAEFQLKITDVTGRTAADVQVMATSGSGTRGTFDVTFPYRAARTGPGALTAYFYSPENGRPVTVDTVPLTLTR
ncbi:GerMN domain-containing protein [Streptomyces sp. enrichment culture]|uniref:GerMN domain-containing protein n=1 Tax=Streptomyces sp. enrichment culture TaxID=1795815 RepID=UPI003F56B12F